MPSNAGPTKTHAILSDGDPEVQEPARLDYASAQQRDDLDIAIRIHWVAVADSLIPKSSTLMVAFIERLVPSESDVFDRRVG